MTKTIAVTGGKGGTGKSTVATALAYQLAKNNKVLLVDLDVDCPNDHLLLGLKRKLEKKTCLFYVALLVTPLQEQDLNMLQIKNL